MGKFDYLRKIDEGRSISWGGDMVCRYFVPLSILVFDAGLVKDPDSRL